MRICTPVILANQVRAGMIPSAATAWKIRGALIIHCRIIGQYTVNIQDLIVNAQDLVGDLMRNSHQHTGRTNDQCTMLSETMVCDGSALL